MMRFKTEDYTCKREADRVLQNITNHVHTRQNGPKKPSLSNNQFGPQGKITSMLQNYLSTRSPVAMACGTLQRQIQTDASDIEYTIPDELPGKKDSIAVEFSIMDEGQIRKLPEATYKTLQINTTKNKDMRKLIL